MEETGLKCSLCSAMLKRARKDPRAPALLPAKHNESVSRPPSDTVVAHKPAEKMTLQ